MGKVKQRTKYVKRRKFAGNQFVDAFRRHKSSHEANLQEDETLKSAEYEEESPPSLPRPFANILDDGRPVLPISSSSKQSLEDSAEYMSSVSFSKIQQIGQQLHSTPNSESKRPISGYRLVDMTSLNAIINECLLCPACKAATIKLSENFKKKRGLSSCLCLNCDCGFFKEFYTSKPAGKNGFEVNKRAVYSMRSCGQGYSGIQKFCALMNMPKPMTANNFDKITKTLKHATQKVAENTMKDAAKEIRSKDNVPEDGVVDAGVSCDGSWQRRGFSSLNGVVTAISIDTGKILDTEPITRTCKACKLQENTKKSSPEEYEDWKATHKCPGDYRGSAPNMEAVGAKRIFSRSVEKNGLRYTDFYGDGDSKSFPAVENIYDGIRVKKFECIEHVQKRVGTRLRKLKQENKGIGGKGKLTATMIDCLQNYYGIAIRQNVGNKDEMRKAIHASLFHVASSLENNWHTHCPDGPKSWCGYKRDKASGRDTYKPGAGLPLNIVAKIKPTYNDLSSSDLLGKCLHGKTQNQNECFNGMIWERIPKTVYVGYDQLQLGVYDAVAHFNIGRKASIEVYQALSINPGRYMMLSCSAINRRRLYHAGTKNKKDTKDRRKVLRGKKKNKEDIDVEKEGVTYGKGEF